MKKISKIQLTITLVLLVVIIFLIYSIFFTPNKITYKEDPTLIDMETFTTNVQGGEFNYLKMGLTFQVKHRSQKSEFLQKKRQIRRIILNISTSQDGRQILQNAGKEQLKQKIKEKIQQDFAIEIKNIYFTDFVLAD